MMREAIGLNDTLHDVAAKMGDGNPGGINIAMQFLTANAEKIGFEGWIVLMDLDDMNIRGSQLWAAYKDFADCDLVALAKAARARSLELVDAVNEESENCGGHVAVQRGGSKR